MYKFLKGYSNENPEKFNKDFIMSRNDKDILEYIKDIFKALEILNEIEILEVKLETDESNFLPAINSSQYYKPILQSRLNKIHYKLRVTPSEEKVIKPILVDENEKIDMTKFETKEESKSDNLSFIIEKDLFINKLIDNSFYINEGIRYFLIYQIVDNSTYGTKDAVSLKSLLMPITVMKRKQTYPLVDMFDSTVTYDDLPVYDVLLFANKINPVLYVMGKYAFNSIITFGNIYNDKKELVIDTLQSYRDISLIDKFNKFFGTDIEFSDDFASLNKDGRTVLRLMKDKSNVSSYISVDSQKLKNKDSALMSVLGSLSDIKSKDKKKTISFSYDDFTNPYFWVEKLSTFFTKNSEPERKLEKIKTMLISLDRLMDQATRKILNLTDEDKTNTLTVLRYMIRNFETLSQEDNQDLNNKRIRLYEYQLYPLRKYFSDQIYRVLNSPTRSRLILDRMFSNLNPMYIIKQTVVNELLRYYNSTNEMNLYSTLLKYTFRGPQSINRTVSVYQRDLHESYAGRLSLVASSASDPGISGTLVPFVEVHDYFFKEQENLKKKDE
jgi:hypothetical protein